MKHCSSSKRTTHSNRMKRMTLDEMRQELDREIAAVARVQDKAWKDQDVSAYFRLQERMNGLFYSRALIRGQNEVLGCYQTGMNPNSGGAKYGRYRGVEE